MNAMRSAKVRPRAPLRNLSLGAVLTFTSARALGAPTGGVVRSGEANIDQAGNTTTVRQSSNKASIDWQAFSIAKGEAVRFDQPSASAVTLNRVVGSEQSVIQGALNANGQIFLINPNGVLFGEGSQVNTAGLVASTLDIRDEDFQAGHYSFKGDGQGSIENQGTLTAEDQGYIALLGKNVTNDGVMVATRGTVALASGEKVTLNFRGNSLFEVSIDQGTLNALVENKQAITADGGKVLLTAKAADELLSAQVNNTGVIQARTLEDLTGIIHLHAYGGTAHIDGKLDASAPSGGSGGFIETSGEKVQVAERASISTFAPNGQSGTWLIDPNGYTIAASGGDISGATLSNNLKSGNVEIQASQAEDSDGNIYVNDAVSWSADTTLTLTATNDIYINRSITAEGANAGLSLNFGKSGDYHILTLASFSGAGLDANGKPTENRAPEGTEFADITLEGANAKLTINSTEYTLIHSVDQLLGLLKNGTATGNFALAQDLDFASWSEANATRARSVIPALNGTLSGLGHEITNLTLTSTGGGIMVPPDVGFIAYAGNGAVIRDIGITNANIAAATRAGILLGDGGNGVRVSRAYSTGSLSGTGVDEKGGLIGRLGSEAVITDSFSLAQVQSPRGRVGGLIGSAGSGLAVRRSHATGNVTGRSGGGLIGQINGFTTIADSYATGRVTVGSGNPSEISHGGGLVGLIAIGERAPPTTSILNSFARGDVLGEWVGSAGGLVGSIEGVPAALTLRSSYATGNVTASPNLVTSGTEAGIGGLIGRVLSTDTLIQGCFATGDVTVRSKTSADMSGIGLARVGGLIGLVGVYSTKTGTEPGTTVATVTETNLQIQNSYAAGEVTAPDYEMVGGLVGKGIGTILIDGSYATGDVTGRSRVGGLVGALGLVAPATTTLNPTYHRDDAVHTIQNSWSSGKATAGSSEIDPEFGGLVGSGSVTLLNSYWDSDKNPTYGGGSVPASDGVRGLPTQEIQNARYYIEGKDPPGTSEALEEALARARAAEEELERVRKELQKAQSELNDAQTKIAQLVAQANTDMIAAQSSLDEANRQLDELRDRVRQAQDEADRALGLAYDAQSQHEQDQSVIRRAQREVSDAESLVEEALLAVRDATEAVERAKAQAQEQIELIRADAQKQIDEARAVAEAAKKAARDASEGASPEDPLAKLPPAERARILDALRGGATQMADVWQGDGRRNHHSSRALTRFRPRTLELRWKR